jgi:hypothetical protein
MIRISIALMLYLLACCGCAGAADVPRSAEVAFTIASGEFGAPPETITVTRRDDKLALRIERDRFGNQEPQSETVTISRREFEDVWDLVTRQQLDRFAPQERPGRAPDFGVRTLRITVNPGEGRKKASHEVRWSRPLTNEGAVTPLIRELGRLSRAHAKRVPPMFFP